MKKWFILFIVMATVSAGLLGGLLYVMFTDTESTGDAGADITDGYVSLLQSDYDDLIRRVSDAEKRVGGLTVTVGDLEQTGARIGIELEESNRIAEQLRIERDRQRLLNIQLAEELENSKIGAGAIGDAGADAEESVRRALALLEQYENGTSGSED